MCFLRQDWCGRLTSEISTGPPAQGRKKSAQKKEIDANASPNIIPGLEKIMMRRRPMISMSSERSRRLSEVGLSEKSLRVDLLYISERRG